MNKSLIIQSITAIAATAIITSCASLDPDYAAYKKQQAEKKAAAANPYGAPTLNNNNQYSVPGVNGETGSARAGDAPYQPLPGVPTQPPVIGAPDPAPIIGTPVQPTPTAPTAHAGTHTVVAGESLWRISRKYGVTVPQLKAANNLQSDTIWVGQKLNIPSPN